MAISLASLGVNPDRLYHGQPPTTGATLYTAPGTTGSTARAQVATVVIANPAPAAIAVRMGLVPQGATDDGTHFLLGDQSIPANSSLVLDLGLFMRPGDTVIGLSGSLPAPVGLAVVGSTTGGTLAAASYYYKVTATNANGETVGSSEAVAITTGATSSVALSWTRLLGATGYKVYRATSTGNETILATVPGGTTTTYTDTGATTSAGAPPTTGTAAGCIFTLIGAELPA